MGRRGGRLVVHVAPAPGPRGRRTQEAGPDGEVERGVETGAERRRDQTGEEATAFDDGSLGRSEVGQGTGADEVLDRVVPEEGGEQRGDRGQVRGARGDRSRDTVFGQPAEEAVGEGRGE